MDTIVDPRRELEGKLRSKTALVGVIGLGLRRPADLRGGVRGRLQGAGPRHRHRQGRRHQPRPELSQAHSRKPHRQARRSGLLSATADFARLSEPDALLICVPTPLTAHLEPDLSFVVSTTEQIAPRLRPGQIIILESTTYPGTTLEVMRPILENERPQVRSRLLSSPTRPSARIRATSSSRPRASPR